MIADGKIVAYKSNLCYLTAFLWNAYQVTSCF